MLSEQKKQLIELYNQGLSLYKKREWDAAQDFFKKALEIIPDDGPSKLYLDRIEAYKKNPPADDWDGVFIMTTK